MDAEEIQNKLAKLSQKNFKKVVGFLLKKFFLFDAIDVDGSGDGGSDWKAFEAGGQRLRIAIQDTVQQVGWEKKALSDATKAAEQLGVNRYLFFTNRHHQQTTTVELEEKITRETGLSCQIFEARAISEIVFEGGLGGDFLAAIGEKSAPRPPELPEICLCAYGNISADRRNHREEIYNDMVLITCRDAGKPIDRDSLLDATLATLSSTSDQRAILNKAIDWLLSNKRLRQLEGGLLDLAPNTAAQIGQTEQLYLADWAVLEGAQAALMRTFGASWTADDARVTAALIARMFIKDQMDILRHARIEGLAGNWSARLGEPQQKLRDLLYERGVPLNQLRKVIEELTDLAKDRDVIKKLTRTAVFVALEGRDPMLNAAALGCRSWDEVSISLDSSVAIPFLCEKLNGEVKDYIFALSGSAVALFQQLKARCVILPGYLEECAAHLIQAFRYEPLEQDPEFLGALRVSENAFVSFFASLRKEGRANNMSILDFLGAFSRRAASASRQYSDLRQAARAVMPEFQNALKQYGIDFNALRHAPADRFNELQKAFDHACLSAGKTRHPLLREHDIDALGHLASSTESKNESWMMLTWDKIVIQVSKEHLPSAFVVSPEMGMDFAQPCRRLSETQFCALAHRLARATPTVDDLTARIIDRIVSFDPAKLHDGGFRKQLLDFRDEAREKLPDEESEKASAWIEGRSKEFLSGHNIKPPERTPDQGNENGGVGA